MRALWLLSTIVLFGAGWRYDGTSTAADATPPSMQAAAAWSVPLKGAGLSSPVVADGLVLVTGEPTTLIALDLASGLERWRASHEVVDAVPAEQAAVLRDRLAHLPDAEAALRSAEQRRAKLARDVRKGVTVAPADLDAADQAAAAARAVVDEARALQTPARDMLGWSAATPVVDGGAIYASFANGVVARHGLDGARTWSVWLGPPPLQLWGYDGRPASSPLLVDGVLVVAHDRLIGLDAATGARLWEGPAFPHYGTPAVARVGGRAMIITPGGEVVDARTGAVLATGLGHVWYDGPHVDGDVVYMVGSSTPIPGRIEMKVTAAAWRLSAQGEATPLWSVPLPDDRVYASPVSVGDALVVLTRTRQLVVLDKATGAVRLTSRVGEGDDEIWASPVVAGGSLWIGTFGGSLLEMPLDGRWTVTGSRALGATTATPLFVGPSLVWRGGDKVVRYGG